MYTTLKNLVTQFVIPEEKKGTLLNCEPDPYFNYTSKEKVKLKGYTRF